jgi:gamma-glutamyltranspeptidase/glutathione hydrolase
MITGPYAGQSRRHGVLAAGPDPRTMKPMSLACLPFRARAAFTAVGIFAGGGTLVAQVDRVTGHPWATRSAVYAPHAMVATSHPLVTQIGVDILQAGGSAADAAVAINAALGLMEVIGSGIGGDMLVIGWDAKNQKVFGLNGSGRMPRGLSYDQMRLELLKLGRNDIPPHGMLPISVPGVVDAWFELHDKFGKLPMEKILQPAIDYAENGFPVTDLIAHYWVNSYAFHGRRPGAFRDTYGIHGHAPTKGEMFRNPDLASTYRKLVKGGRDVFYRGEIADQIDAYFRKNGGWLRKEDFAAHKSEWAEPVSTTYRGCEVFELPPNTQGIVTLMMLNILEGFDLRTLGFGNADTLHLMIETKKLVFEDRARWFGDPKFANLPVKGLISKDYANERRELIDHQRASYRYEAGFPPLNTGDTISFAVADNEGNMIAVLQSNYRGFGSGVVIPGLGFCFQDRGQLFSMEADHPNVYAPGKRPFHTNIPVFVKKDGKPWLAFGFMGGPMQPQGQVQIITDLIDFDMDLQEACDAVRWQHNASHEGTGEMEEPAPYVTLESGFPWETVRALLLKGHDIRWDLGGFGGFQGVMRDHDNGTWIGASEGRKDGQAAGY